MHTTLKRRSSRALSFGFDGAIPLSCDLLVWTLLAVERALLEVVLGFSCWWALRLSHPLTLWQAVSAAGGLLALSRLLPLALFCLDPHPSGSSFAELWTGLEVERSARQTFSFSRL